MTPTARLLLGVVAMLGATAVLSPPVAWALEGIGWEVTFSRVYNRVFEVLLVGTLIARRRQLALGSAESLGWRAADWRGDLLRGFAIGVAGLAVALTFCWAAGGLVPEMRYPSAAKVASKTVQGLGAATVVGAFEEVIFRGILLRRLSLDLGARAGVVATTVLYAVVHLLHPTKSGAHDAMAGVRRTLEILSPLADPAHLPTFLALLVFGALLVWARLRTGSLWTSIGIHAAWVALFRIGRIYFRVRRRPGWLVGDGWPPLVGSATGVVALAVTGTLLAWTLRRRPRS